MSKVGEKKAVAGIRATRAGALIQEGYNAGSAPSGAAAPPPSLDRSIGEEAQFSVQTDPSRPQPPRVFRSTSRCGSKNTY
eukprot:scaffold23004_cov104-Isochrysis_galbana.AAC.2